MERIFWDDTYQDGHAVDATRVTKSVRDLAVAIEALEKENHQVVGLKVTDTGVWIIVSNDES